MNLAKSMAPDLLARNTLTTRTEELTSAVRNLETSLQSILLPSAHDSLEDSSQLYSAALQYMVWPLEALAVRRHVALTPLTQSSTVIYNKHTHITDSSTHPQGITTIAEMEQQLRAALLHNSTMVDRIESLPSPHLWNVIAQLEKQSATLRNAVHMLYKDLEDMVPSNSGTNDQSTESSSMEEQIRSVVQSQTAALIRIASRLSIVHDQVERLKNIHRSAAKSSIAAKGVQKATTVWAQKPTTARRDLSSKLSQASSSRTENEPTEEDMSVDMSRSDSPGSTALLSRASTTDAKRLNRTSSFAANRNARLKAIGSAPAEPPSLSGKGDEKTRAYIGSSNAFESSTLEIQYVYSSAIHMYLCSTLSSFIITLLIQRNLVVAIFDKKKNLAEDEIRNLLNLRVSSKDMTPDQQMAAANKLIKRLKDTLSDLAKGKNDFVAQAIIAEKNARNGYGWSNTLEIAQLLDEERTNFKRKLKQMETDNSIWKDNAKDTMRELSIAEDKMQSQQDEIDSLRKRLQESDAAATQAKIALQVEKARNQDIEKQYNRNDMGAISLSNLESVKAQVRKDTEKELRQIIQAEKVSLRDELRRSETRIRSLESQLSLGETQLARAVADAEVSA